MVLSSGLAWIVVSDLKKSKKFFEQIGLSAVNEADEYGWAEFSAPEGGTLLGVAQANDPEMVPGTNAVVTFTVKDIEKSRAEFKKKGVQLIGEVIEVPGHVKMQTFLDLDGNVFQIVEKLD